MALIDLIVIALGMLSEVGVLVLISRQKTYQWSKAQPPRENKPWIIVLIALLLISALLLLANQLLDFRSQSLSPASEEQAMIYIFAGAGVFIFFYGMILVDLLPPVNAQSIFTVNLVVLVHLLSFNSWIYLGIFLIPSLWSSLIFFRRQKISYTRQAFLYFWYLELLVHLAWISQE
ncbi:MAG: hypothetical protein AAFU64_16905, partial [Bacteroidota bacterium]